MSRAIKRWPSQLSGERHVAEEVLRIDIDKNGVQYMTVTNTDLVVYTYNSLPPGTGWNGRQMDPNDWAAFHAEQHRLESLIYPERWRAQEVVHRKTDGEKICVYGGDSIAAELARIGKEYTKMGFVAQTMRARNFVHTHQYTLLVMHEAQLLSRAQLHRAYVHLGQPPDAMPDETCTSQQLLVS